MVPRVCVCVCGLYIAVTEMEIQQGLLSSKDASQHCLCFMRHVTNLEDHVTSRRAQKYLDTIRVDGQTTVCAIAPCSNNNNNYYYYYYFYHFYLRQERYVLSEFASRG